MLTQETRLLVIFPESGNCQIEKQQLVNSTTDMKCDAYVQLFRSLGLNWAYSGAESLWLTVSTYGLSVSGSEKGYFYTSLLEPLDGTLVDNIEEAGGAQRPLYRHIENNWYLFYDAN